MRVARAEAEAAAEQRLAALDQARREEREAAVREGLALGFQRVRTRPLASPPWHAFLCTPSRHAVRQTLHQAATEHTRSGPGTGARAFTVAQQAAVPYLARSCAPSPHALRQCAERLQQSAPAGGPGMVSWRRGACCRLLTRECPAIDMVDLRF